MAEGMLYFIAALLLMWPSLLAHELGHWVAARSVGLVIVKFTVGSGPLLYEGSILKARVILRALPTGGMVFPAYFSQKLHRNVIMLLGGVAGDLLFAAALWGVGPNHDVSRYLIAFTLVNLIPFRTEVDGRRYGTDGYQIRRHIRHHLTRQGGRVAVE